MTQVSILSGITARGVEFGQSVPTNLEPVIVNSGISKGQLRSAAGAVEFARGPGIGRGGIEWNGVLYRVMGARLVSVSASGVVSDLGDVGGTGPVRLDYSFDRLIIRSGMNLWYYSPTIGLIQVTDVDLGLVVDAMWIDGYTMFTDGTYVGVTELNDPTSVIPTKYGSAEADPDAITGLIKVRGEAYVLGTNTIQVLQNVGGNGFPFATVTGATIPVGCVSATAKTLYGDSFAFVGSGRGDALGVFVAGSGSATKISTRLIDDTLSAEPNPAGIVLERRVARDEYRLIMHLSDASWCYLGNASQAAGEPVWYRLTSGVNQPYRLRSPVMVYGRTIVEDATLPMLGELTADTSAHFGNAVEWQFDAGLIYNGGKGAIVDMVELIGLPGRGDKGEAFLSMTRDGVTYTTERAVSLGALGERGKRVAWRPHLRIRSYAGMRFRGYDKALIGVAACEVTARPLTV